MVYRGGPKRAALFVRAVAVVAPSLQGGIFDSSSGRSSDRSVRAFTQLLQRVIPSEAEGPAFDSLNAICPCITMSSRIPLACPLAKVGEGSASRLSALPPHFRRVIPTYNC